MDTIEKVYCTGHDNNDALVAALASKNNCDPMAMAAMMNQNDYMNNPFCLSYLDDIRNENVEQLGQ